MTEILLKVALSTITLTILRLRTLYYMILSCNDLKLCIYIGLYDMLSKLVYTLYLFVPCK